MTKTKSKRPRLTDAHRRLYNAIPVSTAKPGPGARLERITARTLGQVVPLEKARGARHGQTRHEHEVRDMVRELLAAGYAICSSSKGFYRPKDTASPGAMLRRILRHGISEILFARSLMSKAAFDKVVGQYQMDLQAAAGAKRAG